ncbi:citrate lyase beta subunit [Rhizoclosmatium globosum]|uniref:Citrate lyase beta subunit n=1 Tax=Rhizoclosmatium globosum TaxID=329046 RepID=A0A1Y2CDF0_9FUNG|nr:hypothetical protein HDU99_007639 [Rhizoclosmatium hyalinum]ORY45078.1 citrate lyase beta subunit [Rhizoclosmatium globosum]|eukprot:ORY45078.1 citrate lyase beta subunit [Rhizoclosmatium globosum]
MIRSLPRFRRSSILYIPGSDERKIAKALSNSIVDTRVLDLEDSVAIHRKSDARANVLKALSSTTPSKTQELCVRINSIGSGFEHSDLVSLLKSPSLDSILIPKVNTPSDVQYVSNLIDTIGVRKDVKILASIESAKGLLNLGEIIGVDAQNKNRIEAIVFAAEDYAADLGLVRTPSRTEMVLARQLVVTHAVANGLQAIDLVCVDFKDEGVLREECREGRTFGFTGKQAIHPNQVQVIQECFMPSEKEIAYATRIIEGSEHHKAKGAGAFDLDGKMIDAPVVLWAQRILAKASKK